MGPLSREELEPTLRPLHEASMLPPRVYVDETVAAWEAERLFLDGWVCAGHVSSMAERGVYLTREVGGESLLVVGDDDGRARAFFNVCRHRGARLVEGEEGTLRRIQCPYHAWSYAFDGTLRNAPHTDELADFDPSCFGLTPVRSAVVGGLVLLDVGGTAAPADEHVGALAQHLERYRAHELRRAAQIAYDVGANWKAIVENYSECLHCPGVHPELNRLSHYLSGRDFDGPGAWCGGSMTLSDGAETMATGGGALVSLHPDYLMLHTLWPRGAGRTEVVCEWLFEPETMAAPGFDPGDAVSFWDTVNRQDWHVCELAQRGVGSRGYRAGRYTPVEHTVHAFDRMVAEAYLARA